MALSTESLTIMTRALLVAVLLASRGVCALHIQHTFTSPSETNNFVVDAVSRRVYLASVNAIYQLNGTLATEVSNSTGPVRDNVLCHAPQLPQAPCEYTKSLTDNHNKLLALDREQGVLVTCGSVYQGFCELRKMDNVSQIAVEFPMPNDTVFPSMLNVVANHPNASTAGLVFRSQGGIPRLLVAATYTGLGTDYFPKNHSKEDLRFENTPEIAIRSLNTKDLSRLFTYDINPSEDNVFKIKQEVKPKHKLSFVRVFAQKSYSYIAMNNNANSGFKESQPNSILARICLDTDTPRRPASEGRKLTESYIQMGLQCGASGNIYNRLVSIFPADIDVQGQPVAEPYLFGVFAKSNRKSALCAFRVSEIEETIRQGRRNCSNGPNGEVQVLDSVIQGSGAECEAKAIVTLHQEQLNCGAAHLQHPLALRKPIRAEPLYEASGISSVAVDNIHNHTVVFLGTTNGRLRKNAEDCPGIMTEEFPPWPTGITQDVRLSLSNVEQDTELNCDFGNGQSYKAHWLDGQSAVECRGVTISPLNGPLSGGTLLTVVGKNLGRRAEEVEVYIGNVSCQLLPHHYTVSVELVCMTGASSTEVKNSVEVRVGETARGYSKEAFSFSYVLPRLSDLKPIHGPIAGGTRLTIRGASLQAGSTVKVRVNTTRDCKIERLSDELIECVMPPAAQDLVENVTVCVEYDEMPCERQLSGVFFYEKNPVISIVKPNKSYLSGGRNISVIGQSFDLVQTAEMHVVGIGQSVCTVASPNLILCHSPAASQSQQAMAQFYLNGILYRRNGHASTEPDMDEEEESNAGHFLFEYVEDPQFYTANKEKLIKHHPGEPLTLIINKGPSELDLTRDEYSVMIGSERCDISFDNKQMFHCTINRTLSSRSGELPVTVHVGNFHKVIAVVQMGGSELAIVVTVVVCCVLLLLCTVDLEPSEAKNVQRRQGHNWSQGHTLS
ncbi:Plexin-D1 [Bagarius yarrelli]|uniref:Plexin-D1 n=1 Tax=Bagarius yarrelli TaxID=175774 RepID=A0A556U1Y7_BAGYA|nr:Plexin-D1 [Bagarius yarrelli]